MAKLKALAAKRIGKVPVLAVVLVLAVGGLAYALKAKGSPSATTPADGEPGSDAVQDDTQQPSFTARTPSTVTDSDGAQTEPTNDTWGRQAIEWLIVSNNTREDVARNAITKYLNGDDLTSAEGQLKDMAVRKFGLPPNLPGSGMTLPAPPKPLPVNTGPAKPAPKPAPPKANPPANQYVTVKRGDTLSRLAASHGTTVSRLKGYRENAYIFKRDARGDKINPGDKVRVK